MGINIKGGGGGTITINGVTYTGNNISMRNGKVTIDGVEQDQKISGVVEVRVSGTLASLDCDSSVTCNDVHGSVNVGGSITCADVSGSVNAGGSIKCREVGGNASAGGSINTSRRLW